MTANTADLLAELAESRYVSKQDQARFLAAIAQRLATANEIFSHGEQDRFASVALAIVLRPDFASERWGSWVTELDKGDQTVFEPSSPAVQAEQRFENDSYFLCAAIARISLRPATPASKKCFVSVNRHKGGIAGARLQAGRPIDCQQLSGRTTVMKRNCNAAIAVAIFLANALLGAPVFAQNRDEQLLRARETVWRAWFAGDTKTLEELVPPETIVMSVGEEKWKNQADILRTSSEFHARGGKLIRLEFPRTEVQHFGDVAIVWSSYELETEVDGKRSVGKSRVTEIFVWQRGRWTNPGWHTDEEK